MPQEPPATLPADFFNRQEPPDTLPADFDFGGSSQPREKQGVAVPFTPFRVQTSPQGALKAIQEAVKRVGKEFTSTHPGTRVEQFGPGSIPTSTHKTGTGLDLRGPNLPGYVEWAKSKGAKIVIYNRAIWKRQPDGSYKQSKYTGPSPHTDHVHIDWGGQSPMQGPVQGPKQAAQQAAKQAPKQKSGLDIVADALRKPEYAPNTAPVNVPPTRNLQDVVDRPKTVAKAQETRKAKEGQRNVAIQQAFINTLNQEEMATRPRVGYEDLTESEINPPGARLVPSDQTSSRKVLEQSLGDPYRTVTEKVGKPLQRAIGKHIRNLTFGLSPLQKFIESTNPTMTEEEVDEAVGTWLGVPENVDQAAIQGALALGGPAAVKAFGFLMRKAGQSGAKVAEAFGPQVAKAVDEIPLSNADEAMFFTPKVENPSGLPPNLQPKPQAQPKTQPTPPKAESSKGAPLESIGGPPGETPSSKPTGEIPKDPNITEAAAGLNPIDIIKKADDLNTPNFTLQRRPEDWSTVEQFRTPLDVTDAEGNVLVRGSLSRLAGDRGVEASKILRGAERRITQASLGYNRAIDVIKDVLDNARGAGTLRKLVELLPGKARRTRDEFYEAFVDLVERDFTDPIRASTTGPLKDALDMHDALTENWRKYIIDSRRELGIDMPDDWGVTEKGYFRHLFLGDFVLKDGENVIGTARTYAEAQKKALQYVEKNPGANITAQARDMSFGDPTLRLTNRKYWKTVGNLADSVGLTMDDIMEDVRGVIGRQGSKHKFLGALLQRKGVGGYSKAYEEVMRIHAAQLVRSMELTKLNKELTPIIESVAKDLPGVADAMKDHLDALWGIPTKGEKRFGEALMRIPVLRNYVGSPAMAARGLARRLTNFQSVMKLHLGVRAPIINALQPFATLWPYLKTREFADLYGDYMRPETRQMLRDKGVLTSASKLESGGIIQGKKAKTPFNAASDMNRGIGYLYGYRNGLKKGLSEEAAHESGLAWAEKVEFDNSVWNAPPALRTPAGRVFGQFKGFTIKNLEHIADLGRLRPGDTKLTRAGRVLKYVGAIGAQGGTSALTLGAKVVGAATIVNTLKESLVAAGMDPNDADSWATAVAYGAPALLGADISGSVTILDEPFGNTWQEKLVNFTAGPTVTMVGRGIQEAVSDKPINEKIGRIGKAITPAVKQVDTIQQVIQQGPNGVRVRVGKDEWVNLSPHEAVLLGLGFQPVAVSKYYDQKDIKKSKKSGVPKGAQPVSGKVGLPAEAKPVK